MDQSSLPALITLRLYFLLNYVVDTMNTNIKLDKLCIYVTYYDIFFAYLLFSLL